MSAVGQKPPCAILSQGLFEYIQIKYFKIVTECSKIKSSSQNVYKTLYNCIIIAIIAYLGVSGFATDYKYLT